MIKHIFLIALALLLVLTPSFTAAESSLISSTASDSESFAFDHTELSESGISALNSSTEIHFPHELVFHLEAESSSDIINVRLYYQVDRMNYAEVTSENWPAFTPSARIEISWVWDMRRASLPPGAEVTYWWAIEDAAGNKAETSPDIVYFDDNRYKWQSSTVNSSAGSSKLTLFWYEGDDSFAQELMEVCEVGLARLGRDTGVYLENPVRIYVYASSGDLRGAMIFPMEWTGGVAFTGFGIIVIGISPGQLDWGKRALVHELTHLVVHQATFSPYGRLPTWLDEGIAMYNEGEPDPYIQSWLRKAIAEGKLISVRSLCSPFSADPDKAYLSYAESYSLVEYLLDNYGQAKMLNLLSLFKQGSTYDEALIQVYGFDIEGLDAHWRETLATTVVAREVKQSHPALIAVLSALAAVLALAGALALEERTWRDDEQKSVR